MSLTEFVDLDRRPIVVELSVQRAAAKPSSASGRDVEQ